MNYEVVIDIIYRYVQNHFDSLDVQYDLEPAKSFFYKAELNEDINAYAECNNWNYIIFSSLSLG